MQVIVKSHFELEKDKNYLKDHWMNQHSYLLFNVLYSYKWLMT